LKLSAMPKGGDFKAWWSVMVLAVVRRLMAQRSVAYARFNWLNRTPARV